MPSAEYGSHKRMDVGPLRYAPRTDTLRAMVGQRVNPQPALQWHFAAPD